MQAARRNLLKTGLMCTGAAAAAGVSLPASAAVEPKSKIAREEWDVVVVGAGFAGLCAALEAKEKGAKVLLIEKMGRPGSPRRKRAIRTRTTTIPRNSTSRR